MRIMSPILLSEIGDISIVLRYSAGSFSPAGVSVGSRNMLFFPWRKLISENCKQLFKLPT